MGKRSFTLIEIMVALVILGIVATLGFPSYQNVIENQKAKACETNLRALKAALDIYMMEHDNLPGSLTGLPFEYIEKAYARILEGKGAWKIKLAYFIVDWEQRGLAHAQSFVERLARGERSVLVCPADHNPQEHGGISYGINVLLAGIDKPTYQAFSRNTLVLGDCDNTTFSTVAELAPRHKRYGFGYYPIVNYPLAITKADIASDLTDVQTIPNITCVQACQAAYNACHDVCNLKPVSEQSQCMLGCHNSLEVCVGGCS